MLKKDDTLMFYTSPYQRARETTEGILGTLVGENGSGTRPEAKGAIEERDADADRNPDEDDGVFFKRERIKVWEEPRLREQDFGNFQPDTVRLLSHPFNL